ncbi:hypothetical protein AB0M54_47840, partial [Actinoplanes sp. NPDC051470]|uniref:hypothetical protein n=1 Tax=Actinoplanes sp. NPDC051470 TaxID=3157224 RepID=UPI00341D5B67
RRGLFVGMSLSLSVFADSPSPVMYRTFAYPLSRLRGFDMLSLAISVSSMIAGWLALWIGPS